MACNPARAISAISGSSEGLGSGAGSVSRGAKLDKVDRAEASELARCSQRAAECSLQETPGPARVRGGWEWGSCWRWGPLRLCLLGRALEKSCS